QGTADLGRCEPAVLGCGFIDHCDRLCRDAPGVQPLPCAYRLLGLIMTSVVANNLVVEFPIYGGKSRSLKNTFLRAATGGLLARDAADRVVIRALSRLNFEFREGDRVGIVGHNGSGKSTLLRTIAGAYEPV